MNSNILVVVLSLVMLIGSFSIGLLPALIKASNRCMNLISILGAGLLVGVALIVIIPEGMITLNEALSPPVMPIPSQVLDKIQANLTLEDFDVTLLHMPTENHGGKNVSLYLGCSLIVGFLIMLLIDQVFIIIKDRLGSHEESHDDYHNLDEIDNEEVSRAACKHIQNSKQGLPIQCELVRGKSANISLDNIFIDDKPQTINKRTLWRDETRVKRAEHNQHAHEDDHEHDHFHGDPSQIIISTIGLIVHSCADGVALGTTCYAAQGKDTSLPFVIFFALLLHKCPASIGLTTFLRHEKLPFSSILKHLSAFTVTSPICAIASYWLFKLLEVSNQEGSGTFVAVGVLLLVSAGTFMYVAMIHILPEVYCNTGTHRPHTHKHLPEDHIHDNTHFSKELELLTMITGLLAPLLLHLI